MNRWQVTGIDYNVIRSIQSKGSIYWIFFLVQNGRNSYSSICSFLSIDRTRWIYVISFHSQCICQIKNRLSDCRPKSFITSLIVFSFKFLIVLRSVFALLLFCMFLRTLILIFFRYLHMQIFKDWSIISNSDNLKVLISS